MSNTPRLKDDYSNKIVKQLKDKLSLTNIMQVPSLVKIVISRGVGAAVSDKKLVEHAVEELTLALEGMLEPDKVESSIGKAQVLTQFKIPKIGFIAGCRVTEGLIIRNGKARVIRDGELLMEGLINSLKSHKDDAKEVKDGLECGIGIDGIKKFQENDVIEVYEINEVKRKLVLS